MPLISKAIILGSCAGAMALATMIHENNVEIGPVKRGADTIEFIVTNNGETLARERQECVNINNFTVDVVNADIRKKAVGAFRQTTDNQGRIKSFDRVVTLVAGPAVRQAVSMCGNRKQQLAAG